MTKQDNFKNITDEQIKEYYKLVCSVVQQYKNRKMEYADLIQEGLIGLCSALKSYSEEKGKFTTYAWIFIEGSIKNSIYKNFSITTPYHIIKDMMNFSYKLNQLKKDNDNNLTIEQISTLTGYTVSDVEIYLRTLSPVCSLDELNTNQLEKIICDRYDEKYDLNNFFEDTVINELGSNKELLTNICNEVELTPLQQQIIFYRYGFDGGTGKTLQEIANMYNVTRENIRAQEKKALNKIKIYLEKLGYSKGRSKNQKINRIIR